MAYVALGRSEELKDIYIKGKVDPADIHASPEALGETIRLQSLFDERVEAIEIQKEKFWKISYLNVKSLKCHQEDVIKDNFIMTADIFALAETWLKENESITFPGYQEYNASYGRGKGVSVFSRMEGINRPVVNMVKSSIFSAIQYRTVKFDTIFVHWSSGCNNEEVSEILGILDSWIIHDRPTTIMGDMNMDFSEECKLNNFLEAKGFCQLMTESTCDTGSLLDHIYANESLRELGIATQKCSAYYTDHDVITIYIPK